MTKNELLLLYSQSGRRKPLSMSLRPEEEIEPHLTVVLVLSLFLMFALPNFGVFQNKWHNFFAKSKEHSKFFC